MSAPPLVIQGMLVDVKNINAHKCVRLSIDVSAELGAEIVSAFGWPTMVDPVNVVVARLNDAVAEPVDAIAPKERRKLADLPEATQAALVCQREAFWRYLREELGYHCNSEPEAADVVRSFCLVASRADIAASPQALERWHRLLSAFLAWMAEPTL